MADWRTEGLTRAEEDNVQAWIKVAKGYRHGDCGRVEDINGGCDIVDLGVHAKHPIPPHDPYWTERKRSTTAEQNAVINAMIERIMAHVKPGTAARAEAALHARDRDFAKRFPAMPSRESYIRGQPRSKGRTASRSARRRGER